MPEVLSSAQITDALARLPAWAYDGVAIRRTVEAADFLAGIAIVDAVARDAEEMDHHPDIDIRWRTVSFACATHSAGGITQLDLELARRIDDIVGRSPTAGTSA